jgi:hypothetical protein
VTTRYFTKVRQKLRPPLTQTLERFLARIELVVVQDVRFALTGEKPATDGATVKHEKKVKHAKR